MKPLFWVLIASGPASVLLWLVAGVAPQAVESLYSRGLYPIVMGLWSRLTSLVPFAVGPWLLLILVAALVVLFFALPPLRAALAAAAVLSALLAVFVLGWGLNYQRQPWATSHARTAVGGTVGQVAALAQTVLARTNALRQTLPPQANAWTSDSLAAVVTRAYDRAGAADPLLAGQWGRVKDFPSKDLLSWLGIAGIFWPFTGEPLVNPGPNEWNLPFTAAHEAAHLRGWAREDEANFLAFWVLHDSQDPAVAYAAWSSALLYVAGALEAAGPSGTDAWNALRMKLDPAVTADWKRLFAYWDAFRGPVSEAAQAVNDTYLRAQGQTDGIRSYGRMVDLLLAWESAF